MTEKVRKAQGCDDEVGLKERERVKTEERRQSLRFRPCFFLIGSKVSGCLPAPPTTSMAVPVPSAAAWRSWSRLASGCARSGETGQNEFCTIRGSMDHRQVLQDLVLDGTDKTDKI
ncbi:hypothetical protein RRG08_036009 [Elysia crispata]|uniref:Uncharacterized protein n=1 Tax=Elysia crispata TaxID=231223 RepID=A0AAE1AM44_9GAST|nr:hypothetical protein RRG08_036009 [Elysia crispata]